MSHKLEWENKKNRFGRIKKKGIDRFEKPVTILEEIIKTKSFFSFREKTKLMNVRERFKSEAEEWENESKVINEQCKISKFGNNPMEQQRSF